MTAYDIISILHSWNRWIITVLLLIVLFRSYTGWKGNKAFEAVDNRMSLLLMIFVDLQLLGGLILYIWLSPLTAAALHDMGASMKDKVLRFWGVEHIFGMVVSLILIHVARSRSKKETDAALKHKKLFILTLIGFLIMMATIPWPFTAAGAGRGLVRF